MSSYDEVKEILSSIGVVDGLIKSQKVHFSNFVHERLPLSLEIMACYDNAIPSVDIDDWNKCGEALAYFFLERWPYDEFYLFIKASPKNFMLFINTSALVNVIFADEFCYPFAVFPKNLGAFLMEDDSGVVVGSGQFSKAVEICKKLNDG